MDKPTGADSYSRSYRFFYRLQYIGFSIFGPASTNDNRDPRVKLRREHDRRKALHDEWLASQDPA